MSKTQIQINFDAACKQADNLDEVAAGLKKIADQQLESSIQTLSSGWKGESAAAYFSKAQTVKGDILATADSLEKVAASIRDDARRIYNAELEALRIAAEDKA